MLLLYDIMPYGFTLHRAIIFCHVASWFARLCHGVPNYTILNYTTQEILYAVLYYIVLCCITPSTALLVSLCYYMLCNIP